MGPGCYRDTIQCIDIQHANSVRSRTYSYILPGPRQRLGAMPGRKVRNTEQKPTSRLRSIGPAKTEAGPGSQKPPPHSYDKLALNHKHHIV